MDDSEQTVTIGRIADSGQPAIPWADHSLAAGGAEADPAADAAAGLASLSFITTAIRRRARLWSLAALAGLVLGSGAYLLHPPSYQATTEVLLTIGPNEDLQSAIQTDAALAESRPVAAAALRKLGVDQSVDSLLTSFTAVPLTNRVLVITASASSSNGALSRANAITQAFLQFRASQLRSYEKLVSQSLAQQLIQAKAQVADLTSKVRALTGAVTPEQNASLGERQAQLSRAKLSLATLEESAHSSQQTTQVGTDTAIKGSEVVNAATLVPHSRLKTRLIYAFIGLIAGLMLGLAYVAVNALITDRLRRRSDIAYALGAPVKLSMRRAGPHRLLPGHRGIAAAGGPEIQRIARYLRDSLAGGPKGDSLAVIPADRPEVAALTLVAVALACAQQEKQVMVADLCPGSPAARLLGVREPGVHKVEVQGTALVVVIPERGDLVATGPLTTVLAPVGSSVSADIAAAHSSANVLLTLASLDPMFGAEHLATWATEAFVVVTAGRCSWTRVQAIGEMIRLAGIRLVSGVLIGADKSDESLGVARLPVAGGELRKPVPTALYPVNGAASMATDAAPATGEAPDGAAPQ